MIRTRYFTGKTTLRSIPDKECINCNSRLQRAYTKVIQHLEEGSIEITSVPGYKCTVCEKNFVYPPSSREADLQILSEVEWVYPNSAKGLRTAIESWDHLIPARLGNIDEQKGNK